MTHAELLEQIRRVAEKCADRAHLTAGTHYASPSLGRRRNVRLTRRKREPKALAPFLAQPGQGDVGKAVAREARAMRRSIRHRPVKTVWRSAERLPYVGGAFKGTRFVVKGTALFIVLAFIAWHAWAAPKWYSIQRFGDQITPDFDDDFGPDDLPEWHQRIIPGSYGACATAQPVATEPPPPGGITGVAQATGALLHRAIEWGSNPSTIASSVSNGLRALFTGAGKGYETLRLAASGARPAAPPAQPSSGAPATVIPASGALTDQQIATLARSVGWPEEQVPNVVARVLAESGGNPVARDYATGTHQGLLQLGQSEQAAYLEPGASVFDPAANLRAGFRLWQARGWQPWAASDSTVGQYAERGRLAALAPAGSVQAASLTSGGARVITAGGSDSVWYMDHTGEQVQATGGGLTAADPNGFGRMWVKQPMSGAFTLSFSARVTGWGSTDLGGGTQNGLKVMLKEAAPGAGSGPESVRGATGSPTSPGSYVLPILTRNSETFISRNPIGPGDYQFWDTGRAGGDPNTWRQVQVSVQPTAGGTHVTYALDGQTVASHTDTGAGALDGPFWPALRWDGASWEVRDVSINGGAVAGCVPAAPGTGSGVPDPAAEAELSENAARGRRAILAAFPGTTIGGWGERPNNTEHDDRDATGRKASRALDVMTYEDMAKGERVAAWVRAHWDELRVGYLIWNRQIWTAPDRSRPYRGRSPHTDHPHITFMPDGERA